MNLTLKGMHDITFGRKIENLKQNNRGVHACVCPHEDCNKPILVSTIDAICGRETTSVLEQQTIRQMMNIFDCPSCKANFSIPENIESRSIQCSSCTGRFCRLCLQAAHPGLCADRQLLIKNMKAISPETEVMPCPFCLQLSGKDDHCDHVTCYFCKHDYCFRCSAKRSPTLQHGNHYHRKSCKHYAPYDGKDDKMLPNCEECKRLGKLCRPPADLENGDIPLAEIPSHLAK